MKNEQKTFYEGLTARFIAAVCMNMPKSLWAEEMKGWVDNPENLKRALRKVFKPLRRIEAEFESGIYKSITDFKKDLNNDESEISDGATKMLTDFALKIQQKEHVKLTVVTPYDLGFTDFAAYYNEICEQAFLVGLKFCPYETAFLIINRKIGWISDESLIIGSKPVHPCLDGFEGKIFMISTNKNKIRLGDFPIKTIGVATNQKFIFAIQ